MSPVLDQDSALLVSARRVARVAAEHASQVDSLARFPQEAREAFKQERLLGAYVPQALGGAGASVREIAAVCDIVARQCATSGMVYAMHQIQVASIVHHCTGTQASALFQSYLSDVASRQLLLASATSEVGIGGDTRRSLCAVERDGERIKLDKNCSVLSYGAHTDDILVTARRAPDAAENDQVLVLVRKQDYTLEPTTGWDTLGMRGTCSGGFMLSSRAPAEQVLPVPFADISARTMAPISHVLWASVWLGIATGAVQRARETVQGEAKKSPGKVPASAPRLAEVVNQLHTMRAAVRDAIHEYESRLSDPDALSSLSFIVRMNNVKIAASEAVVDIVGRAMLVCGIAGYRNDSKVSLGRYLRDAHSARVMILNDRLYATNANLLLAVREE